MSFVSLSEPEPNTPRHGCGAHQRRASASGEWQAAANAAGEAMIVIGDDGRVIGVNRAFAEWFGLAQPDAATGQPLESLRAALSGCFASTTAFEEKWRALAARTGDVWELSRPQPRVLERRTAALPGGGTVCLWKDVTDKCALLDSLHRGQRLEALGRLAGGIAHDINNLLTAIAGNLSLVQQHLETGNITEAPALLATAAKAALSGRDIVKQLLGHARKDTACVQSFALHDLITDIRSLLKHSISPLILVQVQLPKSLWPVTADRNSIQQVILNLCVNAVDAMKGRPNSRLTLAATNVPGDGADFVRLQVRDNGSGIPANVLKNIFEPFFTTKAQGEGTGLGLSISREIIEKFGGHIECDSRPGSGTVFSVYLPRGAELSVENKKAPPALSLPKPSGRERILVVDDDALVRTVSARLLSGAGYQVSTAVDGIEALNWLQTHDADLVLLDITMPRLSGHDTMREIRRLHPGLPIVMCSGSLSLEDPEDRPDGKVQAPPDGRVSKPYDVGELTRAVRLVLDNHTGATPPAAPQAQLVAV